MFAHLICQGPRAPAGPALGPGSFRRIVDVPFETCVTALDSWQQAAQGGEVRFGDSLLCGLLGVILFDLEIGGWRRSR